MKIPIACFAILLTCNFLCFAQNNTRNKGTSFPEDKLALFEAKEFQGMPYRLLLPKDFDASKRYPVILNLHGRAGIGDDNVSQLRDWSEIFTTEEWRDRYACIMVAPQSWDSWTAFNERYPKLTQKDIDGLPSAYQERYRQRGHNSDYVSTGSLTMAFLLLDELARTYSIDEDRVYVLGHSMGGAGTWNAIWADPKRFAAAIPSAGGLSPWKDAARFKNVAIWAFHGNEDPTVPFDFTKIIFDRLSAINGNMKFTELDGVKHNAANFGFVYKGDDPKKGWVTHYSHGRTDKTPDVWDWLFRQKRP